jgi:tetratricopeptide (TPR) repeat protein
MIFRSRRLAFLLIGLTLFRIAYCLWYREALPYWDSPIADGEVYDAAAKAMAAGDWLNPSYGYRPFLYPLWLGALYTAGASHGLVYAVQVLFGLATVALVYRIGERIWGERVGFLAALLCGLYGPLVAAETKLLDATFSTLLHTGSLAALLAARRGRGFAAAGFLLGLAAVARPPLLLFGALGGLFAARQGAPRALAALGGLAAALLPFCAWNLASSGTFTPLPRNGGLAFLVGHNPRAAGDYNVPPGLSGEAMLQEKEEAALGESGYAAGWRWIREHPADAVLLAGIKLYRFALADEAPLEHDYAYERARVPLLFALPVPFSLLFVVGLFGLWARREPGTRLLGAAVAVHLATAIAFYVVSRYRLLAVPPLALLAAGGATALWDLWKRGQRARAAGIAAACAVAAAGLAVNPLDADAPREAVAEFNCGYAWARRGDLARAAEHYAMATRIAPRMVEGWLELGNIAARLGRLPAARGFYGRVLELKPSHAGALANLALTHLQASPSDPAGARALLEQAPPEARRDERVAFQLGNARKAAGDLSGAVEAFERAAQRSPSFADAWNNLGTTRLALAARHNNPQELRRALQALLTAAEHGSSAAAQNLLALAR